MSIAKHVAYECGQTNVPIQGVAYMPVGAMMLRDYIREGYVESGRGDMYNPDVVAFIPNWIVGTMWSIDYAKTSKPGAAIMLGDHWWAANIALIEALNIEDAFVIEGDIVPADNAPGAVAADVCVFGEEAVAMGAYLANDPLTSSCLIGEDVFKIFLILLCIIIPILVTFFGVELPTGGATGH